MGKKHSPVTSYALTASSSSRPKVRGICSNPPGIDFAGMARDAHVIHRVIEQRRQRFQNFAHAAPGFRKAVRGAAKAGLFFWSPTAWKKSRAISRISSSKHGRC